MFFAPISAFYRRRLPFLNSPCPIDLSPGNPTADSPPRTSNSPLNHWPISRLLLSEGPIKQRTDSHFNQIDTIITLMRVSKAVKVFSFGAGVLLGFAALAPKALAQG